MIMQMILHWLWSVFPAEMKQGWRLVRPDLLLWVALSALLAVAALTVPAGQDSRAHILPALVGLTTALLTATLPPVLFTAAVTAREVTWGQVWRYLLLRAPILLIYWFVALLVALVPAVAVALTIRAAAGDSTAQAPLTAFGALLVFLIFTVRFSFLPFLTILYEREQIAEALVWNISRAPVLGALAWPLVASARLTENLRWRLLPYVLLIGIVPQLARVSESALLLPTQVVCQLAALTIQAVLYGYFRAASEAHGLPPAALIETEA